jgi:hypothetical protein
MDSPINGLSTSDIKAQLVTASHGLMLADRRIAKPIYCPVDPGISFHLALRINISIINKHFGGQKDKVS